MPYVVVQDLAASWQQYVPVEEALAACPPGGLVLHVAGPTDEGVRIIEVWESEEAWEQAHARSLDGHEVVTPLVPPVLRVLRPEQVVYGKGGER